MRILDLCEFFSERGGGVRSYLQRMGMAARAAGHSLTVVAPGRSHEVVEHAGFELIRYPAPAMPYDATYRVPWRIDLMRRLVLEQRPDVVQVSSPFAPALAAGLLGASFLRVYVHHSDPIGCYLRPALQRALTPSVADCIEHAAWSWHRKLSSFCDATVVSGHWLATDLTERGCSRVTAVPFGITRSDLGSHCRNSELRARFMGPLVEREDAALVLISGRLAVDKRQALLIEALHELSRTRPIALLVLGDGPERGRLEREARGLGHVTFLPFTHDRAEYAAILASVDVLVHGALCETYGFVIAEALASGTPVVVPKAGGAGALVRPSCAETYEADATAHEVARAVHRLLARPRAELRAGALEVASTFPSTEDHFRHLFDLYRSLLQGRAARACGGPATADLHTVIPEHAGT